MLTSFFIFVILFLYLMVYRLHRTVQFAACCPVLSVRLDIPDTLFLPWSEYAPCLFHLSIPHNLTSLSCRFPPLGISIGSLCPDIYLHFLLITLAFAVICFIFVTFLYISSYKRRTKPCSLRHCQAKYRNFKTML